MKAQFPPSARGGQEGALPEKPSHTGQGAPSAHLRSCLLYLAGGTLGRTDEMLTIRGNNLYPSALEDMIRQFDGVAEFRVEVRSIKAMRV